MADVVQLPTANRSFQTLFVRTEDRDQIQTLIANISDNMLNELIGLCQRVGGMDCHAAAFRCTSATKPTIFFGTKDPMVYEAVRDLEWADWVVTPKTINYRAEPPEEALLTVQEDRIAWQISWQNLPFTTRPITLADLRGIKQQYDARSHGGLFGPAQ